MATETVTVADRAATNHNFGISATLSVKVDSPPDDMAFDALCLMNAGMAVIDELAEQAGRDENLIWSAAYLLRQAHAVIRQLVEVPLIRADLQRPHGQG